MATVADNEIATSAVTDEVFGDSDPKPDHAPGATR